MIRPSALSLIAALPWLASPPASAETRAHRNQYVIGPSGFQAELTPALYVSNDGFVSQANIDVSAVWRAFGRSGTLAALRSQAVAAYGATSTSADVQLQVRNKVVASGVSSDGTPLHWEKAYPRTFAEWGTNVLIRGYDVRVEGALSGSVGVVLDAVAPRDEARAGAALLARAKSTASASVEVVPGVSVGVRFDLDLADMDVRADLAAARSSVRASAHADLRPLTVRLRVLLRVLGVEYGKQLFKFALEALRLPLLS